jgi:hypothetical protein
MAETMAEPQKAELLAAVKIGGKYGETPGPLETAVNNRAFSEIHLLSNYPAKVNKQFANWLGGKTVIHQVKLDNPTDYTTIFELADHFLREVAARRETLRQTLAWAVDQIVNRSRKHKEVLMKLGLA